MLFRSVDFMVRRLAEQLAVQGISIEITGDAKLELARQGYDPTLGARPLRRAIQRLVEDPLSEKLLEKEFHSGQSILVDAIDGGIVFTASDTVVPDDLTASGADEPVATPSD